MWIKSSNKNLIPTCMESKVAVKIASTLTPMQLIEHITPTPIKSFLLRSGAYPPTLLCSFSPQPRVKETSYDLFRLTFGLNAKQAARATRLPNTHVLTVPPQSIAYARDSSMRCKSLTYPRIPRRGTKFLTPAT